ncbi:SAM-dependent methyltransferase [Nocardia sp. GCM10030253]|uniref:SAM-dependent methyltransferase n=1 Tax=Nocardia sp. GCM10030253 TaxID=3273404 RepID=UPI0036359844
MFDFQQPIAVMFMGVLGYARTCDDMLRIIHTIMAAVPAGSYLVLWDLTVAVFVGALLEPPGRRTARRDCRLLLRADGLDACSVRMCRTRTASRTFHPVDRDDKPATEFDLYLSRTGVWSMYPRRSARWMPCEQRCPQHQGPARTGCAEAGSKPEAPTATSMSRRIRGRSSTRACPDPGHRCWWSTTDDCANPLPTPRRCRYRQGIHRAAVTRG